MLSRSPLARFPALGGHFPKKEVPMLVFLIVVVLVLILWGGGC